MKLTSLLSIIVSAVLLLLSDIVLAAPTAAVSTAEANNTRAHSKRVLTGDQFIQWNMDYISTYSLSGVDLDWEYSNVEGPGCNQYSPEDASNFLLQIKKLREVLDKAFPNEHKEITLAVFAVPWGPGQDVRDVSAFVPYVDRFQIMVFGLNFSDDPLSGSNTPFMTEPGKGSSYGFVENIEYWHAASVPYNKLVGSVPFFGRARALLVTNDTATQYNPAETSFRPFGDQDDGPCTNRYCPANSQPQSGEWKCKNLRSRLGFVILMRLLKHRSCITQQTINTFHTMILYPLVSRQHVPLKRGWLG